MNTGVELLDTSIAWILAHPWWAAGIASAIGLVSLIVGVIFWSATWPRIWSILWHRWLLLRAKIPLGLAPLKVSEIIPESKFIEVDGVRIHYVQGGLGPDVVLLHGIGASTFIWRFVFPLLQTKYRVTALDIPGFGKSAKTKGRDYGLDAQAAIVHSTLMAIGIEAPILVGSSMGGAISLWMGRTYPGRYPRIAALAPAVDHGLVPVYAKLLAHGSPLMKRGLNRLTMKLILTQVLSRRELVTNSTIEAYLEPFREGPESLHAFWSATSLLSDPRLPSKLADLESRVLVIYGERDGMVPKSSMIRLMKILRRAELVSHTQGGHHIMEDEPEWLVKELERFFEQ